MHIPPRFRRPLTNQSGVTYLFMMIFVVGLSISLLGITQQWSVIMKRDREAELIFRGTRIKNAIDSYVADHRENTTGPKWPRALVDLTKKTPKRYLQAVYLDPITGKDFDIIKVGQEVHGVRSTSTDEPYDRVHFKNAKTYQAVRFESTGAGTNCQANAVNPLVQQNCQPAGTPASASTTAPSAASENSPENGPADDPL